MKNLRSKTQDILDRIKKRTQEESSELVKHTVAQVTGEDMHPQDDQKDSPVVEAMQSEKPEPTDEEKIAMQRKHIQRVSTIEGELEKFRKLRARLDQQRVEEFDKRVGKITEPGAPIEKPLIVPKSRPSRRMGAGQKGTGIETRKSKQ